MWVYRFKSRQGLINFAWTYSSDSLTFDERALNQGWQRKTRGPHAALALIFVALKGVFVINLT